jgi:acetoin utilization protein AcuC
MSDSVAVVWDDALAGYDFGAGHPFAPLRVRLAMQLATELGLLDDDHVQVLPPRPATDAELLAVHDAAYVEAVKNCSGDDRCHDLAHGLGTDDNPVFPGMHEATSLVVGGAVVAADAVLTGAAQHAVHLSGGLHHAMPDRAAGFCIYNDLAVAIQYLLDRGIERVAYVDVDVHHGDGVEAAFWDEPRVLTVSMHESGATQFPGTGWAHDVGGADAHCSAVNIALPTGVRDAQWLRAYDAVIPQVVRSFAPQVIVTQMGCDTHARDPLGHLSVTMEGQAAMYARLHSLTHEVSDGRWISTGGGGYSLVEVVPRTWTRLIAEAIGRPLDPATPLPESWRDHVHTVTGKTAPTTLGEITDLPAARPWVDGHDLGDGVDAAVMDTRRAVFPAMGLDPFSAA